MMTCRLFMCRPRLKNTMSVTAPGCILKRVKPIVLKAVTLCITLGCNDATPEPTTATAPGRHLHARSKPPRTEGAPVTPESFAADHHTLPRLLVFSRDNCLPCQIMAPWVDELRRRHGTAVDVSSINLDREDNLALGRSHEVRSVPTQIYLDAKGRELRRHEGLATERDMEGILSRLGLISSETTPPDQRPETGGRGSPP
jgi:hypothetical protein